jgi:hypothetical protein
MSTIPIEVSSEQLLRAVERLPAEELSAFAVQVNLLRARRAAPHLSREESALLLEINAGLPPELQARFEELASRREAEAITEGELEELRALTEAVERRDAERLGALAQLAELRQTTLPLLVETLGLRTGGGGGQAGQ